MVTTYMNTDIIGGHPMNAGASSEDSTEYTPIVNRNRYVSIIRISKNKVNSSDSRKFR